MNLVEILYLFTAKWHAFAFAHAVYFSVPVKFIAEQNFKTLKLIFIGRFRKIAKSNY
jgi:hypothetical protein